MQDDKPSLGFYIDTPSLPKLGYIAEKPNLVISTLESVAEGRSVGGTPETTSATVILGLTRGDAFAFQKLTEENVGKRILFMIGTNAIMAPLIRERIETPKIIINWQSPEKALDLRKQLQNLVE